MSARRWTAAALAFVVMATGLVSTAIAASAASPPVGFADQVVLGGLNLPTNVVFAPGGRVFVAEKAGVVKVYDSLNDPTPSVFADLSAEVYNVGDLGMTGLTLHPNFPTTPYVYVTYTHDAPIGGMAPTYHDTCSPRGACLASGRVSRLTATGNTGGSEKVLVEDWCQAYDALGIQDVKFGPDGMLYVSAGDGARVNPADRGQYGNPCGDPTGEGGSLRAQDLRTSGDPVSLDGSIIRIDPETGAGLADNPLGSSADANARRIVGEGLRNPFRFTFRPGTNEIWIGDVGWRAREEIDRLVRPTDGTVDNFGWPCYEGEARQGGWDALNLAICENLYATTGQVQPYFSYAHNGKTIPTGTCAAGNRAAISSPTFYPAGSYPARYNGGLFFADYARQCLFFMPAGAGGLPDPSAREEFSTEVGGLVDMEIGPNNDLFYVDVGTGRGNDGTIHRIRYGATPPAVPNGYWTVEANGRVTAFGGVANFGNAPTSSAQDLEATPTGNGYWVVDASGGVFAFGDAPFKGAASGLLGGEVVTGISRTATGQGYWLFTSRGRVLGFGDAAFYGDLRNVTLNGPVLDSVSTTSGQGYFMVASDGGVFAFGDAKFAGSMGGFRLNAPVQSLVPDGDGLGYWLVASDGGVFAFAAPFRGSMGGLHLNRPVSGMVGYGNGYLMVAEDGGIFNFSDQPFVGSLGSTPPPTPVVSVSTTS